MKQDDAKNMNQTVSDQNDWNLSPQIGKVKLSSYVWRKISWQLLDFLFWITGQPVSHHTVKAIGNCILEQHQDNYWTSYFQIVWRSLFNKRHVILAPGVWTYNEVTARISRDKSGPLPRCVFSGRREILDLFMDLSQNVIDLFMGLFQKSPQSAYGYFPTKPRFVPGLFPKQSSI